MPNGRYLPGKPLLSNKQRDHLGPYPCFHRVIAGMSVLVVCGIILDENIYITDRCGP